MTFEQIWENLCRKERRLKELGVVVEFESQNLKRLLEQVYEQGQKSVPKPNKSANIFDGIFR